MGDIPFALQQQDLAIGNSEAKPLGEAVEGEQMVRGNFVTPQFLCQPAVCRGQLVSITRCFSHAHIVFQLHTSCQADFCRHESHRRIQCTRYEESRCSLFPHSPEIQSRTRKGCPTGGTKSLASVRGIAWWRSRSIQKGGPQIPPAFPLPPEEGRPTPITAEPAMTPEGQGGDGQQGSQRRRKAGCCP